MASTSSNRNAGPLMLLVGLIFGAVGGYMFHNAQESGPKRGPTTEFMPGGPRGSGGGGTAATGGGPGGNRQGGPARGPAATAATGTESAESPSGAAGSNAGSGKPTGGLALAQLIRTIDALQTANKLNLTPEQKATFPNLLKPLQHIPVVPDSDAAIRIDQIKKVLNADQTKAVEAKESSISPTGDREKPFANAENKKALEGFLASIGANR